MSAWNAPLEPLGGKVSWRRVWLYYGIAFGVVSLIGIMLWLAGADMYGGHARLVFQLSIAFLYMPAPLVAALIVERVARRGYLIRRTFTDFRHTWWRILVYSAAAAIGIYLADLVFVYVFGNLLHVPLVGSLATTKEQLVANITTTVGAKSITPSAIAGIPPVWELYLLGAAVAMPVGLTINGLFAFGEEYGWRGVLMDELRPLGAGRANLLTGVIWAFWHFPIVLLGFDYGSQPVLGIIVFAVILVPFSFLLWRSREFSGTVVTAAIIHGAFNGSAGFYYFFVTNRDPLFTAPLGLAASVAMAVVAWALWSATRRHLYSGPADPAVLSATLEQAAPVAIAAGVEITAEERAGDPEIGEDGTGSGELP